MELISRSWNDYAFSQYDNAIGQWTKIRNSFTNRKFYPGQGYSMATVYQRILHLQQQQVTDSSLYWCYANYISKYQCYNNNGLNGVGRRWNLVSNPFPSYINGNTAAGVTNFIDANQLLLTSSFLVFMVGMALITIFTT